MIDGRNLTNERGGASTVEFALIAGLFVPLCLAILSAGLQLWTKGSLQSTAALTARCAAIGSPGCADAQQFAVTTAGNWVFPGVITKLDVSPAPAIVCLAGASYMKATISSRFWAGVLAPPFNSTTLTSVAYFPVAAPPC